MQMMRRMRRKRGKEEGGRARSMRMSLPRSETSAVGSACLICPRHTHASLDLPASSPILT
eukprot:2764645-Rhodomonas_salina.1